MNPNQQNQRRPNIISEAIQNDKSGVDGSLLNDFANSLSGNNDLKLTTQVQRLQLQKKLEEKKLQEIANRIENNYRPDYINEMKPGQLEDPNAYKRKNEDNELWKNAEVDSYKDPDVRTTKNYLDQTKRTEIIEKWKSLYPGCYIHIIIPTTDRHLNLHGAVLNRFFEDNDINCIFTTAFSIPNLKINEKMIAMRIFLFKLLGKADNHQNRNNYRRIVEGVNSVYKPQDKTLVDTMSSTHLNIFFFDSLFENKQESMKLLSDRPYRRKCQFVDRKKKAEQVFADMTESVYYRMEYLMKGLNKKDMTKSNKTVKIDINQSRKPFKYSSSNNVNNAPPASFMMNAPPMGNNFAPPMNYMNQQMNPQMNYMNPQMNYPMNPQIDNRMNPRMDNRMNQQMNQQIGSSFVPQFTASSNFNNPPPQNDMQFLNQYNQLSRQPGNTYNTMQNVIPSFSTDNFPKQRIDANDNDDNDDDDDDDNQSEDSSVYSSEDDQNLENQNMIQLE